MTPTLSPERTMRAFALLPALGLAGCVEGHITLPPSLTYKVDVIELQSPCPKRCSALKHELSDGQDGALYVLPYYQGQEWSYSDSRLFDSAGEPRYLAVHSFRDHGYSYFRHRPRYPSGSLERRGYDCALDFGLEIHPEQVPLYVQLQGITLRGRGDDVVALNEAQLQNEDLNWTMSLIGDFPLPTPDNEDYEAQIFHIIGGPDERVMPAEDACDDDPRSFWFDLQFTPVSPPQGPQR